MKLTNHFLAQELDLGIATVSRWKSERPKLYAKVAKAYHYEQAMKELLVSAEQNQKAIEALRQTIAKLIREGDAK